MTEEQLVELRDLIVLLEKDLRRKRAPKMIQSRLADVELVIDWAFTHMKGKSF